MLVFVVAKPSPARTLNGGGAHLKSLLEELPAVPRLEHVPVKLVADFGPVAILLCAETIPKELMVEVTTSIKLDSFG